MQDAFPAKTVWMLALLLSGPCLAQQSAPLPVDPVRASAATPAGAKPALTPEPARPLQSSVTTPSRPLATRPPARGPAPDVAGTCTVVDALVAEYCSQQGVDPYCQNP